MKVNSVSKTNPNSIIRMSNINDGYKTDARLCYFYDFKTDELTFFDRRKKTLVVKSFKGFKEFEDFVKKEFHIE